MPDSSRATADGRAAAHFKALVDSSDDAILSKDTTGVVTSWNRAAVRLYGYRPEEVIGRSIALLVPPDRADEEKVILRRILAGEQIENYETDRVRKDGIRISVSLTISPIRDTDNEIVGASVVARNIDERLARERRLTHLQKITAALARSVEPGRAIGVLLRDGVSALGASAATLGLLDDSRSTVELIDEVGHTTAGLAGWQSFPLESDVPMCRAIRDLREAWLTSADEVRRIYPIFKDAEFRFSALAVLPLIVQGRALGAITFSFEDAREFSDEDRSFAGAIAQQVAYALERTQVHDAQERQRMRLAFLAEAGEVLSEPMEVRPTLERLAELGVRHMSDWCAVELIDSAGGPDDAIIAHADRRKVERAKEFRRLFPPDPSNSLGVFHVINSGESELRSRIDGDRLAHVIKNEGQLAMIREFGLCSLMIVPLTARGHTIGALTFISSRPERIFDEEDLELAEDLARRAALAIDTSLLYQREHNTALTLQRALLPETLPEFEGVEIATRYLPAEAGLEVGGDWFDVTESAPGVLDLVIGDVAGRGVHAAAVMGRLAMALRAYLLDERPSEAAVAGLDQLMKEFDTPQMSTLFLLRLELSSGRIQFVRAGHPPALLRTAAGEIVELSGDVSPPVGLLNDARFVSNMATIEPGSTLLLYTDGLVERGRVDLDVGIDDLKRAFTAAPESPAEIVDGLPFALGADRVPDDIALLALRFGGA